MKNFVSSDGEGMQSSSAGRRVHCECSAALQGCPAAGAGLFAEGAALPCSWLWVQAVAALCRQSPCLLSAWLQDRVCGDAVHIPAPVIAPAQC